jgi:hypothetical protein
VTTTLMRRGREAAEGTGEESAAAIEIGAVPAAKMAPAHVALALLLLLAGSAPRAEAAKKVLCFGDSWAAFACDTLRDVLRVNLKDADVVDVGVAGSTAHFWATNPQDFLAVLAKAGSFDYMWLSTGGDDILCVLGELCASSRPPSSWFAHTPPCAGATTARTRRRT